MVTLNRKTTEEMVGGVPEDCETLQSLYLSVAKADGLAGHPGEAGSGTAKLELSE